LDSLAARYGGEEFVVLCRNGTRESATELAEQLRRRIEQIVIVPSDGTRLNVTASFGVAARTRREGAHVVLKRADDALYLAKNQGRNRVVTSSEGEEPAA
jgi:diguanylate cyclase (GGDEF)-like protein